jgi:hypothetical protein
VKSPDPAAADPDPQVADTVRLLHRRRGWVWATVISAVAWLTVTALVGALWPNASGPGLAVTAILVLLLTAVAVVGLVASIVDTVRLRRRDPGLRQRAGHRTAHYPARAHAYSYPPRHRFTWIFGWFLMLVLLGIGVAALPGVVDGVGYLASAESSTAFLPTSYGQACGRNGCATVTNGVLASGAPATWPDKVQLDLPFPVRQPILGWGFGSQLINGDGNAIGFIFAGVLFDGASVLVLVHLVKLVRRWLRHYQQRRQMTDWLPSR